MSDVNGFFLLLLSILSYRFLDLSLLPFIDKDPFVLWKICSFLISPLFHLFLWPSVFIFCIPLANQKFGFCQNQRSIFNPLETVSYPRDRSDAEGIKDRDADAGKSQLLKYEEYKGIRKSLSYLILKIWNLLRLANDDGMAPLKVRLLRFFVYIVKKNRWMVALFEISVSQCLSAAYVQILKNLMGRARPTIFLEKGVYGFYGPSWSDHYHSFPSGHASTAFILATSLSHLFPKWRIFFYSLATFLSLSRIFLLKHYLGDIIVTATFGVILAKVVHNIIQRSYTQERARVKA